MNGGKKNKHRDVNLSSTISRGGNIVFVCNYLLRRRLCLDVGCRKEAARLLLNPPLVRLVETNSSRRFSEIIEMKIKKSHDRSIIVKHFYLIDSAATAAGVMGNGFSEKPKKPENWNSLRATAIWTASFISWCIVIDITVSSFNWIWSFLIVVVMCFCVLNTIEIDEDT